MFHQSRLAYAGVVLLAMLLSFVFVSDDSEAATITVDKFGGSDYTNITQAVDSAGADDTIRVASRTYHDAVEVDKKLTILGGNEGFDACDLREICMSGTAEHRQIIAQRKQVPESVCEYLAEFAEIPAVRDMLTNNGAILPERASASSPTKVFPVLRVKSFPPAISCCV